MARPRKKNQEDKLDTHVKFRVTEKEKKIIVEEAIKSGHSLSEYNRKMILKGKVYSKFTQEELMILRTISSVSNNLNQLTNLFNYFKKIGLVNNMDRRLNEIDVILEELRKIQFK